MIVCESPAGNSVSNFDSTEVEYYPQRFWWTKRIALGSVALAVLIVALWGSATLIAQYRLDVLIASYRAAGEPVYVEDFNVHKKIPEEENAATYYKKAEAAYILPAKFDSEIEYGVLGSIDEAFNHEYADEIERFVSTNGPTIELLKRGADCADCDWGLVMTRPMINGRKPSLAPTRTLAKLLKIAVAQAHENGHDDDAVELLYLQSRLASHRTAGPDGLSNHLVAIGVSRLTYSAIERFGAKLRVRSDESQPGQRAASMLQVRSLIRELTDEEAFVHVRSAGAARERANSLSDLRPAFPTCRSVAACAELSNG